MIFRARGINKKINLEIKLYFFPTFWKITVGEFVNQLIKKSGFISVPNYWMNCCSDFFVHSWKKFIHQLFASWVIFLCLLPFADFFSKSTFSKKKFQEHYQNVKQFASRSGSKLLQRLSAGGGGGPLNGSLCKQWRPMKCSIMLHFIRVYTV